MEQDTEQFYNLKSLRILRGLTRPEVARRANISEWTLRQLENWFNRPVEQRNIPKPETMTNIAEVYQVQIYQIKEFGDAAMLVVSKSNLRGKGHDIQAKS